MPGLRLRLRRSLSGRCSFALRSADFAAVFCAEAVPGLFVGCLLSNMLGGFGVADVALGSAATLAAAWLTSRMPNVWLAAVPPVAVNAAVVGVYLALLTDTPVLLSVVYIAFSQSAICFGIGVPLALYVSRSHVLDGFRRGR